VNDRLPCLATRTPTPATSSAAAVEMLKVLIEPPPVPHVSTSASGSSAGSTTIARRSDRTTAARSVDVSPRTRRATSKAATCTGVALPARIRSNAAVSSSASGASPPVRRRIVSRSGLTELPDTERFDETFGKPRVRGDQRDDQAEQPDAVDVLLDEYAVQRTVREVDHADQLPVIDQRKADERAGRE